MATNKQIAAGVATVSAVVAAATAAHAGDGSWNGFYAGVSAGAVGGQFPDDNDNYYGVTGFTPGIFFGFNQEVGGFVMGGEIAMTAGNAAKNVEGDTSYLSDYTVNSTIDAKVKAGMPIGSALVYGFAGASAVDAENYSNEYSSFGVNFGAGVDFMVSEHMTIGAEYIQRRLTGQGTDADFSSTNDALSLRVGYKF